MKRNRLYTKDEVLQVVEKALDAMENNEVPAREPVHLDNGIPQNASPSDTKISLTVGEAAELIGISKPKMYELVRAGKFHTVNIGKKILISRQSLLDWLKKGDSYGKEAC